MGGDNHVARCCPFIQSVLLEPFRRQDGELYVASRGLWGKGKIGNCMLRIKDCGGKSIATQNSFTFDDADKR